MATNALRAESALSKSIAKVAALNRVVDCAFADLDALDALIGILDEIDAPMLELEPEDDFCLASDDTMGVPFVQDWHRARDEDTDGREMPVYGIDQTLPPLPPMVWRSRADREIQGYRCPMKLRAAAERQARECRA